MLINLIVILLVLALVFYLLGMLPFDAKMLNIIRALVVVVAIVAILNVTGILHLSGLG
jgi:hypothetical protein